MDRLIVAIVGIPLGGVIMVYRYQLKQFTGEIEFAEKYLGSGGTYNLIVIIGLGVSILSLMYGLGTLQEFFNASFGRFFTSG